MKDRNQEWALSLAQVSQVEEAVSLCASALWTVWTREESEAMATALLGMSEAEHGW